MYRIGRKPIILLATAGSILSLVWELSVLGFERVMPVELILVGPIFNVVGGGSTVLVANLYSMVSDMVASTDRYIPPGHSSKGLYLTHMHPGHLHSS